MTLAITGGTGFVGSHLVDAALSAGHEVAALTRSEQPPRPGLTWITGSLADRKALHRLTQSAEAVIHVAGVLNAPDKAGFTTGNIDGTRAMLDAATASGAKRFVHVSSLAAREPQLSMYGESKAQSEDLVTSSGLDWVIVRPPAVYGPGDRETFELFKAAKRGFIPMPPRGRASYIHVTDLCRLLLVFADLAAPSELLVEPDDGHPGGWSHKAFGKALSQAVGNPSARTLSTPAWALRLGAMGDRLIRGAGAKLTPDRANYFLHPDWVVDPARAAPGDLWQPVIATPEGLEQTYRWYRGAGWL